MSLILLPTLFITLLYILFEFILLHQSIPFGMGGIGKLGQAAKFKMALVILTVSAN